MPNCYYYDEQRNHCKCYVNENLNELLAENAKLREERDHWHVEQVHAYGNWEDAYRRATELETENAKLRELVRDMWSKLDGATLHYNASVWAPKLRELGIEV